MVKRTRTSRTSYDRIPYAMAGHCADQPSPSPPHDAGHGAAGRHPWHAWDYRRCRVALRSHWVPRDIVRSEEHTSELQSRFDLVCRLLLEKKKSEPSTGSHPNLRRQTAAISLL